MTSLLWDGKLLYFIRNIFFYDDSHKNIPTENHWHYNSIYTVLHYLNQSIPAVKCPLEKNSIEQFLSPSRRHAQKLFKFLMTEYEDCEFVFNEEIEERLLKRIGKKLVSMRAEINKTSHHSSRK